jgi:hypothetical protein
MGTTQTALLIITSSLCILGQQYLQQQQQQLFLALPVAPALLLAVELVPLQSTAA